MRDRLVRRRRVARPGARRQGRSGRCAVTPRRPGSRARRSARAHARPRRSPAIQSVMAPERMSAAGASAMSTMFTPARPSSSATCGDDTGAVRHGQAQLVDRRRRRTSASSSARRSSRARSFQAGDRLAGLEPLGHRLELAPNGVDLLGDRLAVGQVDVGPDRRCSRRPRGSRRGSSGRRARSALAVARRARSAACETSTLASTCGRWLNTATQPVVRLGVDAPPGRAPTSTRSGAGARRAAPRSAARGVRYQTRALEQVGAGVLDARGLGARDRVARPRSARRRRARSERALGRADVGDHACPGPRRRARRARARAARPPARRRSTGLRPRAPRRWLAAALSIAPQLASAARACAGSRPKPTTSAPSTCSRAARPIEPPISPTPRTATLHLGLDPLEDLARQLRRRLELAQVVLELVGDAAACGPSQTASSGTGGSRR